eukprot:scaffold3740_cov51-Cyclotella_meneghiniana.AAC.12
MAAAVAAAELESPVDFDLLLDFCEIAPNLYARWSWGGDRSKMGGAFKGGKINVGMQYGLRAA